MSFYVHAVIFAGGKSSRMGEDKALLPFGGEASLAQYQFKKLSELFQYVSLCVKDNKFDFDCPLILDKYLESSPLVGILSVFETLKEIDEVFILSVDSPFVDESIIDALMKERHEAKRRNEDYDAIVAEGPNGIEPLCGLYKRSILALVKKHYEEGNHKLKDLLSVACPKTVYFSDTTAFTNLNHPQEYAKALKHTLS